MHYLIVSRLVKYKKVDLVVETFNKLGYPLVIVGTGREGPRLKYKSKKNIKFVGKVSDKELTKYYKNAKALIMPQDEDFGIVSVEAQSYGIPVIAFKSGGALDTVIDNKTGVLFDRQNTESLIAAIYKSEKISFNKKYIQKNAKKFSTEIFIKKFSRIIKDARK